MQTDVTPTRSSIDKKYTWNAESIFPTPEAWDAEVKDVVGNIPAIKAFQGRLKEGPATLAEAFKAVEELMARVARVVVYAGFAYSVDTTDQNAAAMAGKSQAAFGQVAAAISFLNPELLEIGEKTLRQWLKDEPQLGLYEHYVDDLFRKQAHVRSAEVEEILGMLADPFSGPVTTASLLTNADFTFDSAQDSAGNAVKIDEAAFWKILSTEDRKAPDGLGELHGQAP
jgi:oligoendopeptidase F